MSNQSINPVPHLPHHHHGVPILQTQLAPAEREWWQQYASTRSYFTDPSGRTSSLHSHIVLGMAAILFIYPVVLLLSTSHRHKAYLVMLLINTVLIYLSLFAYVVFIKSVTNLYPGLVYPKMLWVLAVSTTVHTGVAAVNTLKVPKLPYIEVTSDDVSPTESTSEEQQAFLEKTGGARSNLFAAIHMLNRALDWGHLLFFMVLIPSGTAMFCVLGQGNKVYGMLAHFIKGGVFFAYGILTLARYCGAFSQHGWAWNRVVSYQKCKVPGFVSMELVESILILFYGSTNIFLERLAASDGPWNAKDLQHALIAFIFIGLGMCGVIVDLELGQWRRHRAIQGIQGAQDGTPGFLLNPFPAIAIMCTGIIMSKHQQSSMLATEIHVLWGTLLVVACIFRGVTYLILPATTNLVLFRPTRPMLELVTSFCLLVGGLMFMSSSETVIWVFEYYGITPMFVFNVLVGVCALLMAWIMLLFAAKRLL